MFGEAGADYWDDMTSRYDFTISEQVILKRICKELDLISVMDEEISNSSSLITIGSMKQDVSNPLLSEICKHTGLVNTLIKSLHLPEETAAVSNRQRANVNKRWNVA